MAKKATTRKLKDSDEQQYLPDNGAESGTMAPPRIAAIDKQAKRYVTARDDCMQMLQEEIKQKAALQELMVTHDLLSYSVPGTNLEVLLTTHDPDVKVRTRKTE